MPELPEVQTTVSGLQNILPGWKIADVWSDLPRKNQPIKQYLETLKSATFFTYFKKEVVGAKVISVERRAKNILINLSTGKTILIHMKMTGHIMVGRYTYNKKENIWAPHKEERNDALRDPFNKFLHVVLSFNNGKQLVLSDMRKFAKVTLISTKDAHTSLHLKGIGPEPLENSFTKEIMLERLMKKPTGKIKTVLMDQSVIAGIGNIYSDEILWLAGIHPEERIDNIPKQLWTDVYKGMKATLSKGIDFGGDSTSDYRDVNGERGKFHHHHNAYRQTGKPCGKRGCKGVILRKVIGGRSAHFCSVHQKLLRK